MEDTILYIEDYEFGREQVLEVLSENNFNSIIAPTSAEECQDVILSNKFRGAILDNNLSHWLGGNIDNAINIDGTECHNGIQIAECLIKRNKNIQIGIFSSNEIELKNSIANLAIKDNIEIVKEIKGEPNKHLFDFLEKFYKLEIVVKPLHKIIGELPSEIKSFYSKKIISSLSMGEHHWKAGGYSWLVGVNKNISNRYSQIEKLGTEYTDKNAEEEFILGIDKEDFSLAAIVDKLSKTKIDKEEIFNGSHSFDYKSNKFLFDYFITQLTCKKHLSEEIEISKFFEIMNTLGEYAKFESQKILFKSFANEGNAKEKIYEQLLAFTSNGFQKILDIYTGRVDDIQNGVAYIKLESVSSGQAPRIEKFNMDFLTLNSMEENSRFEYTISRQPYGGTTSHIELL